MKIRFQADADLNQHIVLATLRHEPALDFQAATEVGLSGLPDQIPHHLAEFVQSTAIPGVLVLPQHLPVALAAEELFLVWLTTTPEESG